MTPTRLGVLGTVGALVLLGACGPTAVADLEPDNARVDLELTDASVPPDVHRSWELLLESEGPLATVTDYEEVVYSELAEMSADDWAAFVADLPDLLEAVETGGAETCAGGTTLRVTVYEHTEDPAGDENRVTDEVEVTSCSESGSDAIDATLRAVTPIAEPTGLPEQARTWPS